MRLFGVLLVTMLITSPALAQTRRAPARKPAPKPPATKTEPAVLKCPSELGAGVSTSRTYCDVLTGRSYADGIIIDLPPHTGPVTLTFDLHNRHTYSEELVKSKRAYRKYTSTIGVLTADNTLLSRAIVQNEFRAPADLIERIGGGGGPGGGKAGCPAGAENT